MTWDDIQFIFDSLTGWEIVIADAQEREENGRTVNVPSEVYAHKEATNFPLCASIYLGDGIAPPVISHKELAHNIDMAEIALGNE